MEQLDAEMRRPASEVAERPDDLSTGGRADRLTDVLDQDPLLSSAQLHDLLHRRRDAEGVARDNALDLRNVHRSENYGHLAHTSDHAT